MKIIKFCLAASLITLGMIGFCDKSFAEELIVTEYQYFTDGTTFTIVGDYGADTSHTYYNQAKIKEVGFYHYRFQCDRGNARCLFSNKKLEFNVQYKIEYEKDTWDLPGTAFRHTWDRTRVSRYRIKPPEKSSGSDGGGGKGGGGGGRKGGRPQAG